MQRHQIDTNANETLAAWLRDGRLTPQKSLCLARQIATQLRLAHEHGVSHGRLTMADIVLVGAEGREHAVVEGFDAGASFHPGLDIHAFGVILNSLSPGHRVAADCTSEYGSERPDSFDLILEELNEFSVYRTWIGSILIGAVSFSMLLHELLS